MPFVRYVLSYLRWNDLFSNRTPLNSGTCLLTCAYHHSNAFWKVIPMFNAKTRFVLKQQNCHSPTFGMS